jgi:hypothetical protein
MKMTRLMPLALLLAATAAMAQPRPSLELSESGQGLALITGGRVAQIRTDPQDHPVVGLAAGLLRADLQRVLGSSSSSSSSSSAKSKTGPADIIIGTLDRSPIVQRLVAEHGLSTAPLRDCFECYQFSFIDTRAGRPTLLIIGADRRGAAYGAIELSRAIGVSPWEWWADAVPLRRPALFLARHDQFFKSPSVKYRGIFINDEDWGLLPWAAYTFDPQQGNIGPKTYAKVFELMLRLRANVLWPAMHEVSRPFNADPANAKLADQWAVVMGSSHAEPMLRNNVGEWRGRGADFNFATHAEDVTSYWRERLVSNAAFENLYTLGMRGIHDSGIVGASTPEGKRALLSQVIQVQTELLSRHVGPAEQLPKIFVPYKEVLEIYETGLALPDQTLIVWPDDNFGHIRRFPTAAERARGGSGVYYHLSYLGAPLSYLWLATTPPDLLRSELVRAHELGAKDFWVFNVGDIKPAELNISQALDLAWDFERHRTQTQREFLLGFATAHFGAKLAPDIAAVLDEYFHLNRERRPEHLQFFLPREAPRLSGLSESELLAKINRAEALISKATTAAKQIAAPQRHAFFELVEYPALASALAHQRFALIELQTKTFWKNHHQGRQFGNRALQADTTLKALTTRYNEATAGGKWRYMMAEEPADNIFGQFRLQRPVLSAGITTLPAQHEIFSATPQPWVVQMHTALNPDWEELAGLNAVRARRGGASLTLDLGALPPGRYCAALRIVPSFPDVAGQDWRVQLDDGHALVFKNGYPDRSWGQGVLNQFAQQSFEYVQPAASGQILRLTTSQPNLLLQDLRFDPFTDVCGKN